MYCYFTGKRRAALKINGAFAGYLSKTPLLINIAGEPPFIEICPTDSAYGYLSFVPDNGFFANPREGLTVTDLKGGYLVNVSPVSGGALKVVATERFTNATATVYGKDGCRVEIAVGGNLFTEELPFRCLSAKILKENIGVPNALIIAFNEPETVLAVYTLSLDVKKIFLRRVASFSTDGVLVTTETFCDVAKHNVKTEWFYSNGTLTQKSKSITVSPAFEPRNLVKGVIPYAFAEEYVIGGDYSVYLGGNVLQNADKLRPYLGDAIGVMPPPFFRNADEVGLIYKTGKNTYRIDYCVFNVENKKIVNLKKVDY